MVTSSLRTPTIIDVIAHRLDTNLTLPGGHRVRLRMPHTSDQVALTGLLGRLGLAADAMDVARALRFDPAVRTVVCATIWESGVEVMVGLGAGARGGAPDHLICDDVLAPGVRTVLMERLTPAPSRRLAA